MLNVGVYVHSCG